MINENINTNGDSAVISGQVNIYEKSGELSTSLVGPAIEWKTLSFNYTGNKNIVKVELFSRDESGNSQLLQEVNLDEELDISNINSKLYPYLFLNFTILKDSIEQEVYFQDINFIFVPAPEIAILKSKVTITPDTLLRGDEIESSAYFENISIRSNAADYVNQLSIIGESSTQEITEIFNTAPDNISDPLEYSSITDNMSNTTIFKYTGDAHNSTNELYKFNNTFQKSASILEDTINPQIVLYADGIEVTNEMFVAIDSKFEIEIYDNSKLPINESKIVTKLNTKFNDNYSPDKYVVYNNGREVFKKIKIDFFPDNLEYGNFRSNLISINVSDASGNRDTLTRYVNVSRIGMVNNGNVYPNPTEGEVNLAFDLRSPYKEIEVLIEIYDLQGRIVKSINKTANIGRNTFSFYLNQDNTSLSSGVYFYRILPTSNLYFDTINGKIYLTK